MAGNPDRQWHSGERRRGLDRRAGDRRGDAGTKALRYPQWSEQLLQFLTRYLILTLGILFFNFTDGIQPRLMPLETLNLIFATYFVLTSLAFYHASLQPRSTLRYRITMWLDILMTAIGMLNDPYEVPPSLLVFIMIVLGNGMRYGLRLFGEALVGCFGAVMLVFTLRLTATGTPVTPGMVFLNLFGGIILVYSYLLMGRIEQSRRRLEENSRIDSLTGLMNRRGLLETVDRLFSRLKDGDKLIIMFADLDRFKAINDTHGHLVGDQVLKQIAGILRGAVRGSDITARIGGDEFVLILPHTTVEEAQIAARRIQERLRQCPEIGRLGCSVTIGIGEAPTHGRTFDALLEQVDKALYRSKAANDRGGIMLADPPAA
ncbi:MAG TPA: GGDEF domain-containing protein [Thiotrichales bacterium]|nr:GGDEF domain-containing protein [Thiotrichales bacterium]